MSRYIGQYGWQPVVYTPLDGEVPVHDPSLIKDIPPEIEVIKTPIWEPYNLYKSFQGRKKKDKIYSGFIDEKKNATIAQKISVFIRGNFFIPDARMFWIKPSIKYLLNFLRDHPVDAIVSTGPPHSMHLIAEKLHQKTGIPWIADFRDPWTNIDFYKDLRLTWFADKRHKQLEKRVLKNATKVVVVTWQMREEFKEICGRDDIHVILNGFDDADFNKADQAVLDKEFSIIHVGSMNKDRNPVALWQALKEVISELPDLQQHLRIRLIGPVDFSVRESIEQSGLKAFTTFTEFVPHEEAVLLQQQAQILLLVINNSPNANLLIPGKLYEYLGSGRPVLTIGPAKSDAAHVIQLSRGGALHGFDDVTGLKARILEYFALYKKGELKGTTSGIEKFTRRSLAGEFAALLSETVGE